jgi:hypothetical protein
LSPGKVVRRFPLIPFRSLLTTPFFLFSCSLLYSNRLPIQGHALASLSSSRISAAPCHTRHSRSPPPAQVSVFSSFFGRFAAWGEARDFLFGKTRALPFSFTPSSLLPSFLPPCSLRPRPSHFFATHLHPPSSSALPPLVYRWSTCL